MRVCVCEGMYMCAHVYVRVCIRAQVCTHTHSLSLLALYLANSSCYGVATISRLLKITGLFCKRAL